MRVRVRVIIREWGATVSMTHHARSSPLAHDRVYVIGIAKKGKIRSRIFYFDKPVKRDSKSK